MARITIATPVDDFDPTEVAVPWRIWSAAGHQVRFATPDGTRGAADHRMLSGADLGPFRTILAADRSARTAYAELEVDAAFNEPVSYERLLPDTFDALFLPGGHAPGMKPYLESQVLSEVVVGAFERNVPVAAICHGVVVAARARRTNGRSPLHGRRTTALPASMELSAWALTRWWLGSYYRTYPTTVQAEVTSVLASPSDFDAGPRSLRRDTPDHLDRGFVVRDGNYLSARWPGDAHRLAYEFDDILRSTG